MPKGDSKDWIHKIYNLSVLCNLIKGISDDETDFKVNEPIQI